MITLRTTLWLILFACIAPAVLMAQANTGSMSGTVTDPNGSTVPGAKVVATTLAPGTVDPFGSVTVPDMEPVFACAISTAGAMQAKRINHRVVRSVIIVFSLSYDFCSDALERTLASIRLRGGSGVKTAALSSLIPLHSSSTPRASNRRRPVTQFEKEAEGLYTDSPSVAMAG